MKKISYGKKAGRFGCIWVIEIQNSFILTLISMASEKRLQLSLRNCSNVFPQLILKRKLTFASSQWLSRNVTNGEIKVALSQMHPEKDPGPGGYNAFFFQKNWDTIWDDVCWAIHSFFNSGRVLSEVNHTFVILVPKSSNASHLNDFRPISCSNTLYKLISRNRLQLLIGELISEIKVLF